MMKKTAICLFLALIMSLALLGASHAVALTESLVPPTSGLSTDDTLFSEYSPVTQALISMVNHNPELKALLEKSIAQAKMINPNPKTNPAQTLEAYYDYVDWAATAMPWAILPGVEDYASTLYDRIDQSLNYFYFINDQPLDELEGMGYYNNSVQYMEPYRTWLIQFTAQYGLYLNTTDSWCDEYLQKVLRDESFHIGDGTYESADNWKTFNQFFARYLSSPDQRSIASPEDDGVVVSPADSKPQGLWQIDENSRLVDEDGVNIKSGIFRSVDVLLGDSAYQDAFAGGTLTHTFLDVNDYHRYHFPVSGTVKEVRVIPGDDAVGGLISWDTEKQKYLLEAQIPGWQMIESRGCVIVETEGYGLVAILPIGMSQISSVNFEAGIQEGTEVQKGDMMGCFLFGGSDIVMLFQKGVQFELTAPQINDGTYAHIQMGQEYGVMKNRME